MAKENGHYLSFFDKQQQGEGKIVYCLVGNGGVEWLALPSLISAQGLCAFHSYIYTYAWGCVEQRRRKPISLIKRRNPGGLMPATGITIIECLSIFA